MEVVKKGSITVLKFELFENLKFLEHCFTSKVGGVSKGDFASLNMGLNTGDDLETVKKNYEIVGREIFSSKVEDFVVPNQVHKTDVVVVTEVDRGNGIVREQQYGEVDGLVTDVPELVLSTVYADCTPLFFADREKRIVGVIHAGWKGTVGKIGKKTVELMVSEFGSNPSDIAVGIGPTIGPCCYRVKDDVADRFKSEFSDCRNILRDAGDGQYILSLWEANKVAVKEAGILDENIEIGEYCTSCNSDLFYSYRRDEGVTGRMAAAIKLIR